MKSILLFVCIVLPFSYVFGQFKRQNYTVRKDFLFGKKVDGSGFLLSDSLYKLPINDEFYVVDERTDSVVIRFLKWSNNQFEMNETYYNPIPYENTPLNFRNRAVKVGKFVLPHFIISKTDFQTKTEIRLSTKFEHGELVAGVVTLPIKVRPGNNFTFEGNVSLGTNIGFRKAISHYRPNYISFVGILALSTVNINKENTNGKVEETIENVGTLSPALGFVFDLNRTQIGIFYGWDFLSSSNQKKYGWIYDRTPWVSIGFGYSIFNTKPKEGTN